LCMGVKVIILNVSVVIHILQDFITDTLGVG
ncbi:variant erythrocyte surface antigen-1 family protein, partial [Babesia divergens]